MLMKILLQKGDGTKNKEIEVSKYSKSEDSLLIEQLDNISVTIDSEEKSKVQTSYKNWKKMHSTYLII